MTFQIYIRPEAEIDLEDAASWYQLQQHGLGYEFLEEIKHSLQIIEDNPHLFRTTYKEVRRAIVQRFPFVIYYQIEGDEVIVIGVIHASRHPQHWKNRLH